MGSAQAEVAPRKEKAPSFQPAPGMIVRRFAPGDIVAPDAAGPGKGRGGGEQLTTFDRGEAPGRPRLLEGHGRSGSASPLAKSSIQLPPVAGGSDQEKWKRMATRTTYGVVMVCIFAIILAAGHVAVVIMAIIIQTIVFKEVIGIAHIKYKERKLPWSRTLNWYFLICTTYFLFGQGLIDVTERVVARTSDGGIRSAALHTIAAHHKFISFCLYVAGLVAFVLNLKKGHYRFQFNQFGITHMALLLVVCQCQFTILNIFEGLFWFILPVILVICNDIMAYFCGFFLGRTPLIKISPKKTWEGFIGGGIATIVCGVIFTHILIAYPYLTCPASDLSTNALFSYRGAQPIACTPNPVFIPRSYPIPRTVYVYLVEPLFRTLLSSIMPPPQSVAIYPIQLHSLVFSIFASLIAPFGGFFASGFKRAFKVKDFSDSIPGHGGMTDRMDCQFVMGVFVHLYYSSFIRAHPMTVTSILNGAISSLSTADLGILSLKLQEHLAGTNMVMEALGGGGHRKALSGSAP